MIKCSNPNCGSLIPDDSKFCPDCGSKIINEESIRNEAQEITKKYNKGYQYYVDNGNLPQLSHWLNIDAYKQIISFKQKIIQKQKEFEKKEPKHKTLDYTDGAKYIGWTVNGQRHGIGTYTFPNGTQYVGDWVNNKRQGKGKQTYTNGERYEGEWYDDYRQGKGIYYFKSGKKEDGNWVKDKFQESLEHKQKQETNNPPDNDNFGCLMYWLLFLVIIFILGFLYNLVTGHIGEPV